MREISTEDLKVGEHIIVDGVEYVAEEKGVDCCIGCDLRHCGYCHLVPCTEGIILKRVEKQPTETQVNHWHTGTPTEAGLYVLFYKDKNFYDVQKITNGHIKTLKERPIFGRFDFWKKIDEEDK